MSGTLLGLSAFERRGVEVGLIRGEAVKARMWPPAVVKVQITVDRPGSDASSRCRAADADVMAGPRLAGVRVRFSDLELVHLIVCRCDVTSCS